MAVKTITLESIGTVSIQKRRGSKSIRIRLGQNGEITVSQPSWLPFKAGEEFALRHVAWIETHRSKSEPIINRQSVGKQHRIVFTPSDASSPRSRVEDIDIIVFVPRGIPTTNSLVQAAATRAARRGLEAESDILSSRLSELARRYDFTYTSVSFRIMKSKWGSCRSDHRITLNLRLLNLDDNLIDYVLVHELSHTKVLNHSPEFWKLVESILPDFKQRRTQLKKVTSPW